MQDGLFCREVKPRCSGVDSKKIICPVLHVVLQPADDGVLMSLHPVDVTLDGFQGLFPGSVAGTSFRVLLEKCLDLQYKC